MADPTDEEQHVRPFADYLVTTNRGRTHAELTEQFADLVRAVKATGKGGKLTLTINVKPLGKNNAGQFQVSAVVSARPPEDDRPVSIFFADDAGNLHREDPNQLPIEGIRVVETPAPRVITPTTRKATNS